MIIPLFIENINRLHSRPIAVYPMKLLWLHTVRTYNYYFQEAESFLLSEPVLECGEWLLLASLPTFFNELPVDSDVLVPITPILFVVEAQGMKELVLNNWSVYTAVFAQWDSLFATCPSNIWPAPVGMGHQKPDIYFSCWTYKISDMDSMLFGFHKIAWFH